MAYIPPNQNGAATSANSSPVVLATDQAPSVDISATGNLSALNDAVLVATSSQGTVIFEVAGTFVGTFSFEASNNSFVTSQLVAGIFLGGLATQSSSFSAPGFYSVLTAGFKQLRIKMSAYTSGTATVLANSAGGNRISVSMQGNPNNLQTLSAQGLGGASAWKVDGTATTQPISAASLPLPAGAATETTLGQINVKTPPLGQTTSAGSAPVVIASDQGQVSVTEPDLFITAQGTQTVIGQNILLTVAGAGNLDASAYRSASVQVNSTGTAGTFIFENSNDGANFQTMTVYNSGILSGIPITAAITATVSQLIYSFPIRAKFIRLRIVSTITGGSLQCFSRIAQAPWSPAVVQVAQGTASNLNTNVSGSLTTVSTVTGVTTLANGQTPHSTASTGSPLRAGGRVVVTLDTTLVQGDASDLAVTTGQQLITKDFASSENDWQFVGTITTTTQTAIKSAGAAGIRNFVTCVTYQNTNAVATTLVIQDGATTILSLSIASMMANPVSLVFPTPLRGTAATAINYTAGTTAASVLLNVQGYQSF